jgi:hypothetical protein
MATYVHGKGAGFFMDNAAATQVDFSSIVTDAKLSIQLSTAETSHFGSSPKTYIAGQNEATGSVSGLFAHGGYRPVAPRRSRPRGHHDRFDQNLSADDYDADRHWRGRRWRRERLIQPDPYWRNHLLCLLNPEDRINGYQG